MAAKSDTGIAHVPLQRYVEPGAGGGPATTFIDWCSRILRDYLPLPLLQGSNGVDESRLPKTKEVCIMILVRDVRTHGCQERSLLLLLMPEDDL